jgi:hypothetical protein
MSKRGCGGSHRRACCQAIVNQNDCLATHIRCWTVTAISVLAPLQLLQFICCDLVNNIVRDLQILDHIFIENAHTTRRNRTHRKFLLAGRAELSYEKNVQWSTKRSCHLESDGYSSTRQRQDKNVGPIGVSSEQRCKAFPSVSSITINQFLSSSLK